MRKPKIVTDKTIFEGISLKNNLNMTMFVIFRVIYQTL